MEDVLEIYVFDVGHGDNILINFSTGTWGLIDFFYNSSQVEPPSLTHLKSLKGEIIIEFVHISHYHQDHTKGINDFFIWLQADSSNRILKNIWLPGMFPPKKIRHIINELSNRLELYQIAKKNNNELALKKFEHQFFYLDREIDCKKGNLKALIGCQTYKVNSEYHTLCISPSNEVINAIFQDFITYLGRVTRGIAETPPIVDENTLSTILIFTRHLKECEDVKFTFGGDATIGDWDVAIRAYEQSKIGLAESLKTIYNSFIKVSHHGSRHSSSKEIWNFLVQIENRNIIHTLFSTGSVEYPHGDTLAHIEGSATINNIIVEKHSTNQKVTAGEYEERLYSVTVEYKGEANKRSESYQGSRIKRNENNFIAYKFSYDFKIKNSKVVKLIRTSKIHLENK